LRTAIPQTESLAPGARVLIRNAEWLVRRADRTSTGGQALAVVGLSEIVRDKEAVFLSEVEDRIECLDPVTTRLVADTSSEYGASRLYIEGLLRQVPPTDDKVYIAHLAAMDSVPYQLDPAVRSLEQPRQRILIADAVGLGKTLEAGVLVSELIRRGRGKRILVVAVKSMLTQFQKEFWSRFTIPLTRLDSLGIQRVRSHLPGNHNPFYFFDKAIISVDTLKQDAQYRTYLETARWDIIVIDEAHNVAERGGGRSQRARLARLLSRCSDTLIMLSATPHDGRAESFASLMNMLNPTAIANPKDYGPEDIRGLFIRRFKKDVQGQVQGVFPERVIRKIANPASDAEEQAFAVLAELEFTRIDQRRQGGTLFRTTLEKALFSSPAACLQTIRNRVRRLEQKAAAEYDADVEALHRFENVVSRIGPAQFSKYQRLITLIKAANDGLAWNARDPEDRLVIFTERIETLRFLAEHLPADLDLGADAVATLYGELSDIDQQRLVERFGTEDDPLRLLIASDVASEGINLHFLSHRMIHFDIPWSLMVFQQRNGRIDRYGQIRQPQIHYLLTASHHQRVRGDMRILEILIDKDEQAVRSIGDPSALLGVYDQEAEERIVADAIESDESAAAFGARLQLQKLDPLAILLGESPVPEGAAAGGRTGTMASLFADDFSYLVAALDALRETERLEVRSWPEEQRIDLVAPESLKHRFRTLPPEIQPDDHTFRLTADRAVIEREIREARKQAGRWPKFHYLWPLNPVVEWVNDQMLARFGRHEAPVLTLRGALVPGEAVFVVSGLIPNRQGHPLVHHWIGVTFVDGRFDRVEPFMTVADRTGLARGAFPNAEDRPDIDALGALLPEAVARMRAFMHERRGEFEARINGPLTAQLDALERLRERHLRQLELAFSDDRRPAALVRGRHDQARREIERVFDEYMQWIEDVMTTEERPYIQVVAVLTGA